MPSSWEPMPQPQSLVHQTSSSEAKIALFRSLFRGREDVYPRRFESRKTGKSGYAPACANEWLRGICEKPRIKCAECPNRRFLPVTDEVIRYHLSGQDGNGWDFTIGGYPNVVAENSLFFVGGFGQYTLREDGRAVIVTRPWLSLPGAPCTDEEEADAFVWFSHESRRTQRSIADHLPKQLDLVLGSEIFIAKNLLPPALCNRLIRLAAFQNPEFYRAQAMRRPTYDTPRIVG